MNGQLLIVDSKHVVLQANKQFVFSSDLWHEEIRTVTLRQTSMCVKCKILVKANILCIFCIFTASFLLGVRT